MLKILGAVINLGIVTYLGFQAKSCFSPEQIANLNVEQNPMVLSFIAVVAFFIAVNN
jgi:membrane protein DedA with SNARE-associated domain